MLFSIVLVLCILGLFAISQKIEQYKEKRLRNHIALLFYRDIPIDHIWRCLKLPEEDVIRYLGYEIPKWQEELRKMKKEKIEESIDEAITLIKKENNN